MMWHARQFHQIVLVTGTLRPLAELAARALECELEARGEAVCVHILATRLEEHQRHWTGRLIGEALYGQAKAEAVATLSREQQWNLRLCHGYGNTPLDRHFLCAMGHGHAVNPGRELAATANERDWPVWHWHQEKKVASHTRARCTSEIRSLEGQA
jgi:putative phosphoserine phosphatase/1-acylglycerol-3-phosphate O-acyltransferase